MFDPKRLLTIIPVSYLLLLKTGVEGFVQSCQTPAIIDLTEWELSSSGMVNEKGDVFPLQATWPEDGKILGCLCAVKNCFPLCCSPGYATSEEGCVEDRLTLNIQNNEHEFGSNSNVFVADACHLSSKTHSPLKKYYNIPENDSDSAKNVNLQITSSHCLFREVNSSVYLIGVCVEQHNHVLLIWFIGCMSCSVIFTTATFVGYTVKLELENLQGSIFRSYLASYISCLLLTIVILVTEIFSPLTDLFLGIIGSGALYFGLASMFWLPMISFDIWKGSRYFQFNRTDLEEQRNFLGYAIFAWSSPAVIICIGTLYQILDPIGFTLDSLLLYFVFPLIGSSAIFNTSLYILSAIKIKQYKIKMANMFGDMNEYDKKKEEWFRVCLKLFIIRISPLILWSVATAFDWNTHVSNLVIFTLEALQVNLHLRSRIKNITTNIRHKYQNLSEVKELLFDLAVTQK